MASDVLPVFEHAAVSLVDPKGGIDTPAATGRCPGGWTPCSTRRARAPA